MIFHPILNFFLNFFYCYGVINRSRHFKRFRVCDLSDCSSKNFSAPGFWKFVKEDNSQQRAKSSNVFPYFKINISREFLLLISIQLTDSIFQNNKCKRTLSPNFMIEPNDCTLYYIWMLVNYFFKSAC